MLDGVASLAPASWVASWELLVLTNNSLSSLSELLPQSGNLLPASKSSSLRRESTLHEVPLQLHVVETGIITPGPPQLKVQDLNLLPQSIRLSRVWR